MRLPAVELNIVARTLSYFQLQSFTRGRWMAHANMLHIIIFAPRYAHMHSRLVYGRIRLGEE